MTESVQYQYARFLASKSNDWFRRSEMEKCIDTGVTQRMTQYRLLILEKAGILERQGSRRDIYRVKAPAPVSVMTKSLESDFFDLPEIKSIPDSLKDTLDKLERMLESALSLYIQNSDDHEDPLILYLGYSLKGKRNVCYYQFQQELPVETFFQQIMEYLQKKNLLSETFSGKLAEEPLDRKVLLLTGYIDRAFADAVSPVILLNGLDHLKSDFEFNALVIMLHYWRNLKFVLSGTKLPSCLENEIQITEC